MALRGPALYPTATEMWLAESTLAPESRKSYRKVLKLLQEHFPTKRVNELSAQELVQFLTAKDRAPATVKNYRTAIVRFYRWAHRRKLVRENPALELADEVQPRSGGRRQGIWLSHDEVLALFASCDTSTALGLRDLVALSLAFFTGLRRGELCQLSWGQVDMHAKTISLIGKGSKPAVVGVPGQLHELLFRWRSEYALGLGRAVKPSEPVLVRLQWNAPEQCTHAIWGRPLTPESFYYLVRKRAGLAGVRVFAPHDMRRSFASFLEAQGKGLVQIQAAMRHSSPDTTFRHYLEKDPKRAIAATSDFVL